MALPDVAYRAIGWFSTTRLDRVVHPILYRRFDRVCRRRSPIPIPILRLEPR